jgi:predicted DsbA family dithiol-disulfide isomerase
MMQAKLAPVLAAQKDRVRVVRKMVPLTRIHPHALAAARAACCADALGRGDAMADALFESKVDDLTPEGCAQIAGTLGVPLDKYNDCLASPETDARLARERHEFDQAAVKGDGLPLMWVGSHKMMGAQDDAEIARVLREALAGAGAGS